MTEPPSSTHGLAGRRNGHSPQRQPRSSLSRCELHTGQHHESSCLPLPWAATQTTCAAAEAAQVISGSSALATTQQPGAAASASRHRRATSQISAARSIWSRLRFSKVTTRGLPYAFSTAGMCRSSTSRTARGASGALPSAATSPSAMLAPNAFEAMSWPIALSAAAMSRVVVVFPFVPVTSTIWRPADSRVSRSGSTRRPMTPPITDPSPRPARRDTVPAAPPQVVARRARSGSLTTAMSQTGARRLPVRLATKRPGQDSAASSRT